MLTSQTTLREWIIAVLSEMPDGAARRREVLAAIHIRYGHNLTADDLVSPQTRPHEPNWANRASFERATMVREGLLSPRSDGVWQLARQG
ncbi:hypothetical protein FLP10_15035 [Agromyces intestinalis]|uniref:Restriction system protein Mrr-like N-terminal domain-containing protein n=1 Tax=Agromyces intestinalis TaxID=2592652 RepID=A0A5C1YHA0_9MICO|nr:winged helix-turn-helix domain-containing protein [Agromyces intestinalis]QEO15596.1 hypothetical protein FLP10_15035 [Agromyces intestinalis]